MPWVPPGICQHLTSCESMWAGSGLQRLRFHWLALMFPRPESNWESLGLQNIQSQSTSSVCNLFIQNLGILLCFTSGYHQQAHGQRSPEYKNETGGLQKVMVHSARTLYKVWTRYVMWLPLIANRHIKSWSSNKNRRNLWRQTYVLQKWTEINIFI